MKKTIEKYYCDYCDEEMDGTEYYNSTKLGIRVALNNPKGKAGQVSGIDVDICQDCSKKMNIINDEEYHDYIYSRGKLTKDIENNKKSIINIFDKIRRKLK